jgi:hypothetical protein
MRKFCGNDFLSKGKFMMVSEYGFGSGYDVSRGNSIPATEMVGETKDKSQSLWPIAQPRLEWSTARIQLSLQHSHRHSVLVA